jgi:predicted ATPase/DNA-binding XRE family transcriptional regulator
MDLTQQELAQRVGCSASAIFKIENDERRPSRQIAELLAEQLEISPDQRVLFLDVARRKRTVDRLEVLSPPSMSPHLDIPSAKETPASNLKSTPTGVPLPLTSIIGRDNELQVIAQQIQDPTCHLLTLTGPGGVGKTRLALEVANRLRDKFQYGACFVSLVGTRAFEFIIPTIADSLGFSFSGTTTLKDQLFHFLMGKQILLVLDNLEHLLDGIELLDELLESAPQAKILTTSREQLNLRTEWIFEVQGLPIPSNIELDAIESNSAAALFLQHAKQVRMNFRPLSEEAQAIMRICQLVEGLPLALELAATWVRTLSCREIASEIERGLDFLATTKRDIPERHRSIHTVFEHSWKLLSTEEQVALKNLSVFPGSFQREAAEQVAGASLPLLSALVSKSLVRRNESGRYDQHELVRQYAAVHLQSNGKEQAQTQDRHSNYYAALLEQWEGEIRSPRQKEILAEMGAEMDNVRLAWSWMLARQQIANIKKSLQTLWHFHEIRGWFQEGAAIFGQGVTAFQTSHAAQGEKGTERSVIFGRMLAQKGYFCAQLGQYEEARRLLQKGLTLLRSLNDSSALADALTLSAYTKYRLGEFTESTQDAQESLVLNRALGRQIGIAYCFVNLSYICLAQEEYERAYELSSESLAICREILGDPHGTVDSLITLSAAASRLGRYAEAKQRAEEGLQISQMLNDRWGIGQALRQLGLINFHLGQIEQAEVQIRQCVSQFREIGDLTLMALALIDLGVVIRAAEKYPESKQCFMKALQSALDTQTVVIALQALVEIAVIEMKEGATELALELVTQCLGHPFSSLEIKDHAEKLREELEGRLTSQQIAMARTRTQSMTLEMVLRELASQ